MSNVKTITPNPPADFTPTMEDYAQLSPFKFWCQKVLPLVYDDSLSYYELLCKVVDYLNKTMEDVNTLSGDVNSLLSAYNQLQNYVNTYFSSLDVQEEINNKLDELVESGELDLIIKSHFKLGNAIYIGNSYTDGVGSSNGTNGLYNLTKDMFYQSYVKTSGGVGFGDYEEHSTTFNDLLNSIYETLNTEEISSITHIIFISAMGDSRYLANGKTYGDLIDKVKACINNATSKFSNARCYIAFAEETLNDSADPSGATLKTAINVNTAFEWASKTTDKLNYIKYIV